MNSQSQVAIIIPTYNEAENILSLISGLKNYIRKNDKIIIIDDNSPDGTSTLVNQISKKEKNIFLIKRKSKKGRGAAVMEGFKFALKFKPAYLVEMDADFSHKPEDVRKLIQMISTGKDIIIGSRYLKKSKIINWPLARRVFSRLANTFANALLNVPISDYTNGFRAYTADAVKFLLSAKLQSKGYILLSESAFKLHKAGFSFSEIPIIFVNRKRGKSNTGLTEIKEAFWSILKIRFAK